MTEALKQLEPHDKEANYHERRRRVHELSVQVAKLGILKAEMLRDDIGQWIAGVSPLVMWDQGVATKLTIHFQLFGGSLAELGTTKHQSWIDKLNRGEFIGGFAMYVLIREYHRALKFLQDLVLSLQLFDADPSATLPAFYV